MKILFATDFHGNEFAYRALFHTALRNDIDAIVLGGDLGPYPSLSVNAVEEQHDFLVHLLAPRLREFRTKSSVPIFAIPGNDDCAALDSEWRRFQGEGLWHWIPDRAAELIDAFSVAGLPYVPVTPFVVSDFDRIDVEGWRPEWCPKDIMLSDGGRIRLSGVAELAERPTFAELLRSLAQKSDPAQTIYVMHSPPHRTALDVMQGGQSIGSLAIREFIERRQPPVTLHGHAHNSYSRSGSIHEQMGATLALNPGPSLNRLRAVIVELSGHKTSFEQLSV